MAEICNSFNAILTSLVNQLSEIIGTTYQYKLETLIKSNVYMPLEQFMIYALPLSEELDNRNEAYFDHYDVSKENNIDKNQIEEILNLKSVFKNLDTESKNSIWEHIDTMMFLGKQYIVAKNSK